MGVPGAAGLDAATKAEALAQTASAAAAKVSVSFAPTVPITMSRTTVANCINGNGVMAQAFVNRARFDYDLTGTLAGLLVEPAVANLAQYSLLMSTALTPTSMTRTDNVADMFGTTNASTLTCTAGSGQHFATLGSANVVANTFYCLSVLVKPSSVNTPYLQLTGGSSAFGTAQYVNFDMVNSAVSYMTGVMDAKIKNMGNGIYLLSMVLPATASGNFSFGSLAVVQSGTAARLAAYSASGGEFVTVYGVSCEAGYFPTSFITTTGASSTRANDYVTLNTNAMGMASGVYAARVMFDNLTTQPVKADCSSGSWLIPTSLSRGRIKRVTFSPYVARKTVMTMMIGQSNAGLAGVDPGPTYYTVPTEIDDILRFDIGRYGNGDPVQSGAQIPSVALRGFTELYDVDGYANYPGTLMVWLANRRENRLGLTKARHVTRADALGGIPITYLLSGAEGGSYTSGAPKYFYVNARGTRKQAYANAQALGDTFSHDIVFIQGEDTSIATDQYQTYLSTNIIDAHYADAVTDVGTAPTSFIIMQTSGTAGGVAQQMGPLAHIAETRRRAGSTVVLGGPLFQFPLSSDGQHYQNIGKLMLADLRNYVRRQVVANGTYAPLDIARTNVPALGINQGLRSVGLAAGTMITGLGTGTGGLGTYTVNNSQNVTQRFVAFGAVFDGTISGTTLTVTNIVSGALNVVVSGATVTITFNRTVAIDANWVPSVGAAYGLEWSDASSRTISSVNVSGAVVTLNLSGVPSGAKTLGHAISPCASQYQISTNTGGVANWSSTRSQIYHDTGEVSEAYLQNPAAGWPTIREYPVRFQETF